MFPQFARFPARRFRHTGDLAYLGHFRRALFRLGVPHEVISQAVRELIRQRRQSCQRRRAGW